MNNRLGLGLAVGAGYLLGRTKKLKFAFAVGTFVAGKKLQLSPKALMDFASSQLQNNPQFKEIGDQLREDMRGVGKAATGAIINRQLSGLADKLHDRTLNVQDKAAGIVPDITSLKDEKGEEEYDEEPEAEEEREEPRRQARPRKQASSSSSGSRTTSGSRTAKKATGSARSTGQGAAKKTASSGTAKKATGGTAKKATGGARKTASGATGAAKKTAARKTSAAKGGQNRG
ncbi:DNA primase [Streptomyces sp. NPDC087440]|uniref:DNA primase n=1 Tax=Streptomyces sp. NPDC087440 TaxID=3365790 RepID=UPI00382FFFAD